MNQNENPTGACECMWPGRAVESNLFPVAFDEKMGEYHLLTIPSGHAIMRYCPWCGGVFPESKRDSFFTSPSDHEVKEMNGLFQSIKDADDMRRVLGEPDRIASGENNKPWAYQYTYSTKWETLELFVHESGDGELTLSYGGKYIGDY